MERSEIRGLGPQLSLIRICASLHPGYEPYARTAASPNGGGAKPALEA